MNITPVLALGLVNLVLLAFQLVSGLHLVRIPIGLHKKTGIALAVTATVHATLAMLA